MLKNKKTKIVTIAIIIVALASAGAWAYYSNSSNNTDSPDNHKQSSDNKKDDSSKSDAKNDNSSGIVSDKEKSNSDGSSSAAPTSSSQPSSPASPSVTPGKPIGTFISNHRPNLSGHPAPNTENSTCSTTPGVQCKIRFTKGSTSKYLSTHTTSSNGNTSWNWKLQDVGLSQGTWTVTAIATNGNKTATAQDAVKLVVSP